VNAWDVFLEPRARRYAIATTRNYLAQNCSIVLSRET